MLNGSWLRQFVGWAEYCAAKYFQLTVQQSLIIYFTIPAWQPGNSRQILKSTHHHNMIKNG